MSDCPGYSPERRFNLDEDVIPASQYISGTTPHLNHGRYVARNRHGRWLTLYTGERGIRTHSFLMLAVADRPTSQGSDFADAINLVGRMPAWREPLFHVPEDVFFIEAAGMVLDRDDRLHLVYQTLKGVFYISSDASGETLSEHLADATNWTSPQEIAGPGALLGDILIDGNTPRVVFTHQGALQERALDGQPGAIAEKGIHPSAFIDRSGVMHIAYEHDRMIYYTRRTADGWADPQLIAQFCASYPSLVVTRDGLVIVAYQGEGKVDLRRFPDMYTRLRPGGGSTVSYAIGRDGRWTRQNLLRSSEIMLRRQPAGSIRAVPGGFVTCMEEFWRPALSLDQHGVPWLFYINPARRHVYWSRFLGESFGTHHEARGAYDEPSRNLLVQKDAAGGDIGFVTFASRQVYFDAIPVPKYESNQKRRVVFLDNLEVDRAVGLEHATGQWRKHPEPLYGWGVTGESGDDNIQWCEVRQVDGGFEMRYMGAQTLRSNWMPGRAFSADGIHWEKRPPEDISHLTIDGKPFPNSFWRPIYMEDPDERDPNRRYKGLLARYFHDREIEIRSWVTVASPDAVHWRTVPGIEPVVLGDISVGFHLIRDDEDPEPMRRYKAIMLIGSVAGRAVSVFHSPDLLHWHRVNRLRQNPNDAQSPLAPYPTGPIAIDPDAGESPWEEEVHDAAAWREHGLLMFHYDAFFFGANQHIQKALAVSRDGKHYWRIQRGVVNMPIGAVGDWDSGRDRTTVPLRVGDEHWLYFCGMPAGTHTDADDPNTYIGNPGPPSPGDALRIAHQRPWRVGLAKLRPEGWAYWQRDRERDDGALTTVPFDHTTGQLVVNGTDLGSGLTVELLRADDDNPISGFTAADATFSTADGVNSSVSWSGGDMPAGRYRLRFTFLSIKAKLHSFGFE